MGIFFGILRFITFLTIQVRDCRRALSVVLKLPNANSKCAKEDSIMREIIGQSRER